MKTLKTLALLLFSCSYLWAQDISKAQVPSIVLNQFDLEFPKANDVEWELENNVYHVEFELGWDKDLDAWYDNNGKRLRLQEEISKKQMPEAVLTTLKEKFPSYYIDDVDKITESNHIFYEVELEKNRNEITILVNENGSLIQ